MTILHAEGLTKRFGATLAVNQVSFTAGAGEILGVIGPNGAGKSTLLHMLSHLVAPDSGEIRLFGMSLRQHRARILMRMNIASPYAALPGRLTVRENLNVFAALYGIKRPEPRIASLLEQMGVGQLRDIPISRLSSGQAVRVGLCKALLNDPELLLLDEPTAYLDADIALTIRGLLLEHRARRGMTIILTSHDLIEIELMCDRILLLRRGRIAAGGTPADIVKSVLSTAGTLQDAFLHVARTPEAV